jgi:outer membrane protein TolC
MKLAGPLLLAIWMWVGAVANGGTDRALTLRDCIAQGLGKNPGLKSERFTLAADKENIWKAKASFLPDFTAQASLYLLNGSPPSQWQVAGVNDFSEVGVTTRANGKTSTTKAPLRIGWVPVGTGGVGVTYPIYEDGSILGLNNPPAVKVAKADYKKQDWTIRLTEQDVIAKIVGVFLNVTVYQQKVELDQQKVNLSKKHLEIVQEELALNLVLPQQVDLAKAQLAANEQLLLTSQQRATDSERILAEFLGRRPTQKLRLDQSQPAIPSLPPLNDLLNRVAATHPAVEVERQNVEVAQQQYRLAQTALYPSVKAGVSYSGSTAFSSQNIDTFTAQLGVQVPIFDFGHNLAAEHAALDQVKATQAQLEEVQLSIRESILTQLGQIHTIESNLADMERNYVLASNAVDLIKSEHEQGIANQLALVDAELGLVGAKDDLLLTQLVLRLEYAQLQRLAGGVWAWNR